jgi:hypothetical protein
MSRPCRKIPGMLVPLGYILGKTSCTQGPRAFPVATTNCSSSSSKGFHSARAKHGRRVVDVRLSGFTVGDVMMGNMALLLWHIMRCNLLYFSFYI